MSPLVDRDERPEDFVPIGRVGRSFGLKGAFHFRADDPAIIEQLSVDAELFVENLGLTRVESLRTQGTSLLLFVDRVRNPDRARALVGSVVYGPAEVFGEDQRFTLLGVAVVHEGRVLGEIVDVAGVSGAEILTIETDDGRSLLLPLHAPYLREEDDHLVLEDPPEGLLELGR